MKPRDYCCCAIPTITTGIYTVLLEQFVLGIVVATLAVAAPAIVGSDSFTPWVLAIICYIAAGLQVLGFIGVAKERGILFRRYLTLHIFTTLAAFVVAGVMIGLSAGHHDDAQNSCIAKFFTAQSTSASLADTLCDIFPWVDVGVMGGLWLLLAISQIYFYTVVSGYSAYANDATGKYAPVADIPMRTANGSTESLTDHHGHARNVSVTEPDPAYPQQPYSDNPSFPLTTQAIRIRSTKTRFCTDLSNTSRILVSHINTDKLGSLRKARSAGRRPAYRSQRLTMPAHIPFEADYIGL
ncbi:unnamed protein product [Peniophora sp. CBMAI 1063]|nr:unnamed protein product [Peniophora sp. CBMAI 1063]